MRKERYTDMKSPITGGRVKLVEDIEEHIFRKEKYKVHVRYYICEDTGEQFTVDNQDELLCNELYSLYRIRHGIPFADEIRSLREKYALNYTQISKIVGFGVNQWKQYEQGVVPSESNGKIIVAIRNKDCMLGLLEASRSAFEEEEYQKVKQKISNTSEKGVLTQVQQILFGQTKRGLYNGFSEMNVDKLQAMVRFLIGKTNDGICPTKLNKEMFYADFYHFRQYGRSISGLSYRAVQYGPVPEHFDTIFDNISNIEKIRVIQFDSESVRLQLTVKQDEKDLKEDELKTLNAVATYFSPLRTSEVVELSHQESVWQNYNEGHRLIPYAEAFELKIMLG